VKTTVLEAFKHQVYPFEQVLNDLNYSGNPAATPCST
jgi:hypothetical protein